MSANEKEAKAAKKAERKAAAAAEQDKKNRSYRRNAIIIGVIVVVLIAFALLVNSNYFYTHTTAVTVGDTKYTPAETSYFYRSTYSNIYQNLNSQLGDYTSMILDSSQPLSEQQYPYDDTNRTWEEVIAQTAQEDMARITVLYDTAVKSGRTLTAEEQEVINNELSSMEQYASSSGYPSLDKFLAAYFGKGMDTATYTRMLERSTLASAYSNELAESFEYTDAQLADYYAEHAAEYDTYYYYSYPLNASDSAFEGLEGDELATKMHEAAQEIADATTDLESMTAAIREYTGEATVLSIANNPVDNIGDTYKEWITDPARQKNDVAVFDIDGTSYVVLFIELCKNDYYRADFRHILVNAVPDEEGNYTDEALAAAKEKAELLLETWRADPTEDNFSDMAMHNSEDNGSYENGGLYEGVVKYQMVPGVNSFLFDEGKGVGDTGIVFGQSTAYTGYHVMYYAGQAEKTYADELADSALRNEDYDAAYEKLASGYTIKVGSGLRFVTDL